MPIVTRFDLILRSTEEKLTIATESLPRWIQKVVFAAAIVMLITQVWPR